MNSTPTLSLLNQVALVTGCNKGIGRAIARGFALAGADIIGISSSLSTTGADIEQEIQQAGRKFYAYQADLTDRNSVYQVITQIKERFERIDILVNNAGIIKRAPAAEYTDGDWDQVLSINLDTPFLLSREIGKTMLANGGGSIIFIASLLTFQGGIFVPAYTASKSAIGGLVRALSNEWAAQNVRVNGIAPGYIATANTEALQQDPHRNKAILERIPAGRWGQPEDLVGPALFLASDAAKYVHGTILTVDGGWMGR